MSPAFRWLVTLSVSLCAPACTSELVKGDARSGGDATGDARGSDAGVIDMTPGLDRSVADARAASDKGTSSDKGASPDKAILTGPARYVTPTGAGNKTGVDWANAYAGLPSSGTHQYMKLQLAALQRGTTYYVAAGSYPGYVFDNAGGGPQPITIRKATPNDHGTDVGWSSALGSKEAVFSSGGAVWVFSPGAKHYRFEGQVGNGKSPGGYGFRLTSTASRAGSGSLVTLDSSGLWANVGDVVDITLDHIELDWNNGTAAGPCTSIAAFEIGGAKPNYAWTVSNSYIHHAASGAAYFRGQGAATRDITFHNNYIYMMGDETNSGACPGAPDHTHWETFWFTDLENLTISNNVLENAYAAGQTGWLMLGGVKNAKIYNNVFFCSNPAACAVGGNGVIASWSAYSNQDIFIYHNSFIDLAGGHILFEKAQNVVARNNLYYNTTFSWSLSTQSHEACGGGQSCAGTNAQSGIASSIFVSYGGDDFRLQQHTQAGIALGAPYDVDKSGKPRKAWDRGAYEAP